MSRCVRRLPPGALGILVAALLVSARPAPAQDAGALRLAYLGYLGAAEVVRADVDLELGPDLRLPDRYRMAVRLGTTGDLHKLVPFDMEADAYGLAGRGGVQPARYSSSTRIFRSSQSVTLSYGRGGEVEIESQPPTVEARQAAREGLARATLDPLSATMAVMNTVLRTGSCAGRIPVFDGARRYDLHVTPVGRSQVTRLGVSLYEGEATECSVRAELLAGFRQADIEAGLYPETTSLWLAPVLDDASPILVRVATHSMLGPIRLDLIEAELRPGGSP